MELVAIHMELWNYVLVQILPDGDVCSMYYRVTTLHNVWTKLAQCRVASSRSRQASYVWIIEKDWHIVHTATAAVEKIWRQHVSQQRNL